MDPPEEKKRKPVRWCLHQTRRCIVWAGVLLLFTAIGLVLYAWSVNTRGKAAINRVAVQLNQRDLLDVYPNFLEGNGEEYPDEAGTSAAYWRAAMEAEPDVGERPILPVSIVMVEDIEPRQQYHPDTIAAMQEVVEHDAVFFDLVEKARKAKAGQFVAKNPLDQMMGNIRFLGGSRAIARWMQARANLAEAEGDDEAFTESLLAILNLNNNLKEDPQVITALVRVSIDALMREATIDGLSRIELTEEHLSRLISALEQRRADYDLKPVLDMLLSSEFHRVTADIKTHIAYREITQAIAFREYRADLEQFFKLPEEKGVFKQLWHDAMLSWCPGRYELENAVAMERAIQDYDDIIAIIDDPKQVWDLIVRLHKEETDRDASAFDTRAMQTFAIGIPSKTILRADSRMAAAIAALKVERYRIEHARWPDKLEDATGEIPNDARGQAIRYRITPDGVMLYEVGDNVADEQGYNYREDDNVPNPFPDADDYAIRLYNPELRNAIPPPAHAIMPEDAYDDPFEIEEGF